MSTPFSRGAQMPLTTPATLHQNALNVHFHVMLACYLLAFKTEPVSDLDISLSVRIAHSTEINLFCQGLTPYVSRVN
jgi:hypothetical protein